MRNKQAGNKAENSPQNTVVLIEDGITELAIYDNRGRKMEVLISGNQTIGSRDIQLDMTNYQSGRYYLQLTTPTITKTEFIEVLAFKSVLEQ